MLYKVCQTLSNCFHRSHAYLTTSPILEETVAEQCLAKRATASVDPLTKISDKLFSVIVDETSFLYGFLDRCKVGIRQDHVCSQFGDVSAAAHGNTDVSLFKRRSVVNTITGLRYRVSL